jgi:cytochrome c oxidase subunit II
LSKVALAGACLLLAGCSGAPSLLDTRGPQAARIADLWWLMFWLATGVFALVVGLLAVALFRRRARRPGRAAG